MIEILVLFGFMLVITLSIFGFIDVMIQKNNTKDNEENTH